LQSCSGAFSLALLSNEEMLLATDRMGIHPLIFTRIGNALVFGSRCDAINSHPLITSDVNGQAIYNYVYFHMVPGPETIHSGQQRLSPGEYLHFKNGKCEVRPYWRMQFRENSRASFAEMKGQFASALTESVREAAEDAETGTFLSGGTDSSTLAGLLGQVKGEPARTYSIGFAETGYDEMQYARIASTHFGTRHNEYYVTPDDIVSAIPRIAEVHDQPFGNSSAVPTYYCARMAKQDGVQRLLGGDGGDELFGGNERYAKQTVFARYEKMPRAVRKFALEPAVFAAGGAFALTRKAKSYIEQASMPMPARLESYNLLERFGAARVFTADFLASVDTLQPLALLESAYHGTNALSLINRMLALDFKFTLADNDLPKVTKSCELAAIDVRFPMLADSVVAFSATLAPELKLKGTKLRWFFKEALRDFLPPEILAKQKHGFGLPFGPWLKTHQPLRDLVRDSLHDLKSRQLVRPEFLDEVVQTHLTEHAGYYGTMIWVLVMLEQWFKRS
jgi:asparagine synthase (glutamine-hydrolysing)